MIGDLGPVVEFIQDELGRLIVDGEPVPDALARAARLVALAERLGIEVVPEEFR